ncbi:hypothetical protein [Streptomyces sp. NPDC048442]|uniref:hypothetical protein n=1 Tax=Streptomyces sp. NPDC048442 TaxID=3154823 RepID=UPI003431BD98
MPVRNPPPRTLRPPTPACAVLVLGAAVLLAGFQKPDPTMPVAATPTPPVPYMAEAEASYLCLPGPGRDQSTVFLTTIGPPLLSVDTARCVTDVLNQGSGVHG